MYSLCYLRRQADALQRRLRPVLQILRLRNLAMEFCDELDEAALSEDPRQRDPAWDWGSWAESCCWS